MGNRVFDRVTSWNRPARRKIKTRWWHIVSLYKTGCYSYLFSRIIYGKRLHGDSHFSSTYDPEIHVPLNGIPMDKDRYNIYGF